MEERLKRMQETNPLPGNNSSPNAALYTQGSAGYGYPSSPQYAPQQQMQYNPYQQQQQQQQLPVQPVFNVSLPAPPPPPPLPTYPVSSGVSIHSDLNSKQGNQEVQNIPPAANVAKPAKLKGFAKQIIQANIFTNPSNRDRVNLNTDQQQVLNMTKRM